MGSIANDDHPLRLFLFDSPRTSCHAFYKLFSQHPQIDWGRSYHDFSSAALYGPERMQPRLKHGEASEKAQLRWGSDFPDSNWWTYELSVKALLEKVEASEKTVRSITCATCWMYMCGNVPMLINLIGKDLLRERAPRLSLPARHPSRCYTSR